MPETLTERLAALVALVAAVGLVFVAIAQRSDRSAVPAAAPAQVDAAPETGAEPASVPAVPVAATPSEPEPAAEPPVDASLVVSAVRGECWISVRAGSVEGKVLYEGILEQGRTERFAAPRLWMRLGAAANLDLTLNGKKVPALAAGTVDVVATPAGVRPAA
jgi:Domain of unknown function (DUF4115)